MQIIPAACFWSLMFHSVNAGFHTDSPRSTICPRQPLKRTPVEPKHHRTSSMSTLCNEKPGKMSSTDLTWPLCFVSPLSKPLVTHHDPENTFNSIIEPPSVVDQPSPSWSSQESFSSFENSEDGPVYCVPHEGEDIRHLFARHGQEIKGVYKSLDNWPNSAVNACPVGASITCIEMINTLNAINGRVSWCSAFRMWLRSFCRNWILI